MLSLLLGLLLAVTGTAFAAVPPPAVQLELTPGAMQLAPGEVEPVLAVLRNDSASPLDGVKLRWSGDAAAGVDLQREIPDQLADHSSVVIPFAVRRPPDGSGLGKINFYLTWSNPSGAGPGAALATLEVQDRSFLAADKLATIRLEAAVDHLDENQSALLYIVVSNIGPVPITVDALTTYHPDFIGLDTPPLSPAGQVLQPGESGTFKVRAHVSDQSQAGNQRVIISAHLKWSDNGVPRTGTLSVAQTLPVTIFGESDLLKVVGVPSFLFLPGFLFLATFGALWTRVKPRTTPAKPFALSEMALLSVSLSFVSALIYPRLMHRNYLQGYGVRDVMTVWFGSILVAVLTWSIWASARLVISRIRELQKQQADERARLAMEAERRALTPSGNDTPSELLARLMRTTLPVPPPQAEVAPADVAPFRAFVARTAAGSETDTWVIPPIELRAHNVAKDEPTWTREKVFNWIEQNENLDSYEPLLGFLRDVQQAGWQARWGSAGPIQEPTPFAAALVTLKSPSRFFELLQLPP